MWPEKKEDGNKLDYQVKRLMSDEEFKAEYLNMPLPQVWKIEDGLLIIYHLSNIDWVKQILETYRHNDDISGVVFIIDVEDTLPHSTTWAKFVYSFLMKYPKPIKTHCPAIGSMMHSKSYAQSCHELGITVGKTIQLANEFKDAVNKMKCKPIPLPKSKFHK